MALQCFRQSAFVLLAALLLPSAALAQARPAQQLDPVMAIIDAFRTHDVVALDEGGHGNEQGAAFRERLYRDPRFQAVVNDIVVEAGNGRHQAIMDRYVAGEDVPEKELRIAWLETTQAHSVWDKDMYPAVFRTIRELNQTRPKDKQLRVLLGDTPFPPAPGSGPLKFDAFPAELVQREVIAKKRKALVIFGGLHFLRVQEQPKQTPGQPAPPLRASIVARLETAGVKVFSIATHTPVGSAKDLPALQSDIASWPRPSLALIKDTTLGVAPTGFYFNGTGLGPLQEQFDALLYIGPQSEITYANLSASLCADPDYIEMRTKRMTTGILPAQAPAQIERFLARCAAVVQK